MNDSTKRRVLLIPVVAAVAMAVGGCSGSSDSTSTTSPTTTTVISSTETFAGSVGRNGSAVHAFTVKTAGYTLLAGYTSITPASVTALGLGIGTWDATTSSCGLNQTQNDAAKSASTGLSGTASSGNYCVRVYDGGNIAEGVTASYTLQVEHY
jgi:hypothetical protein